MSETEEKKVPFQQYQGEVRSIESISDEIYVKIGRQMERERKVQKISQQNLANAIGVSRQTVAAMESGRPGVKIDVFFKYLFAIGGECSLHFPSESS